MPPTDTLPSRFTFPQQLVRPAVAADIAAFRLSSEYSESYRKNASSHISLLMIRRDIEPYRGLWALPGGFLRADESIEACAHREILEETGVEASVIMPVQVFSQIDRDPRGRVISHVFTAVITDPVIPSAHTDAAEACWFDITLSPCGHDLLSLKLTHHDTMLSARLRHTGTAFGHSRFDIVQCDGFAFDHAAMIATAFAALRQAAHDPGSILDLLPEPFTLTALQQVHEVITGMPTSAANFRRKIAPYVEETDDFTFGSGHRPARLYIKARQKEDPK